MNLTRMASMDGMGQLDVSIKNEIEVFSLYKNVSYEHFFY